MAKRILAIVMYNIMLMTSVLFVNICIVIHIALFAVLLHVCCNYLPCTIEFSGFGKPECVSFSAVQCRNINDIAVRN